MTRGESIGRNQARTLLVVFAMMPRPIDARFLAYVADPKGDLTHGRRIIAGLHARGLIFRDADGTGMPSLPPKYRITSTGVEALVAHMNRWTPRWIGE